MGEKSGDLHTAAVERPCRREGSLSGMEKATLADSGKKKITSQVPTSLMSSRRPQGADKDKKEENS